MATFPVVSHVWAGEFKGAAIDETEEASLGTIFSFLRFSTGARKVIGAVVG